MTQTLAPSASNIIAAYMLAPNDIREHGMNWYSEAKSLAMELDPTNFKRAAGVIAALSPLTSWPLNVRRAREIYATGMTNGLPANVDKAIRIYNHDGNPLDILSGPKVRSFYLNIIGDHSADTVTVDRHAIDVACFKPLSDKDRAIAIKGKAGYRKVADMYVYAADILSAEFNIDMSAAQLQAIVWVWWRNTHAVANHGNA
jgi:hypothetical protein